MELARGVCGSQEEEVMTDAKAVKRDSGAVDVGGDGHGTDRAVARERTTAVTVPPWLTLVVLLVIVGAVAGAAFFGGYNYRRATAEPVAEPVTYTVPEGERFFVDARLGMEEGKARFWQIRYISYDLVRLVTVEGDAAKDRLVAWIKRGERR
jgi:hypothetical protein